MADLRLLGAVSSLIVVVGFVGCSSLKAPRLAGRVVDAASGKPIAGAEIFTNYEFKQRLPWAPGTSSVGNRWTTTDADGRFAFEEKMIIKRLPWWRIRVDTEPNMLFLHRQYGMFSLRIPPDSSLWTDLDFRVSPEPVSLKDMENPTRWAYLCMGLKRAACQRVCEIAYQDRALCERLIRSG